ncbi:MAG: hypothetical protein ACRDRN_12420 [Sciscionella sp.]
MAAAVVFMCVHLLLAGVILALPLGKWIDRALCVTPTKSVALTGAPS